MTNQNDPFFLKYSAPYQRSYQTLYNTDKVLGIISPRDHKYLEDKTKDQIRDRSKILLNRYCDRDNVYVPKFDDGGKKNSQEKSNVPDISAMFKPQRRHDQVRKLKEENEKLMRIEHDLANSTELKVVQKPQDIYEFEYNTNWAFNRNFDKELYDQWEEMAFN